MEKAFSRASPNKADTYINDACAFIDNNFAEDIGVSAVAAHVAIDRTYLYRIFLREKGISPLKYLQTVRLERARAMLEDGKIPLSEVHLAAGFKNRSRFSRLFKTVYGVTPAEYAKKQK